MTALPRSSGRITRPKFNLGKILPPKGEPFHLRIAGSNQPREEGYLGLDSHKTDSVDYVWDLNKFPYPIDDGVVDRIFSFHYLHRLDGLQRIEFMNECWRVLKPGGLQIVCVPYYSSMRAIADPLVPWPPICEWSFVYFNKEWREREKPPSIDLYKCDFDFGYGHDEDADIKPRNDDYRAVARKHWLNSVNDLHVTMTARK